MVYDEAKMNEIKLEPKNPIRIRWSKKKKMIVTAAVVVVLLLAAGGAYYFWPGRSHKSSGVCSDKTLSESAPFLNDNKAAELVGTVQYIERQPNYQTDPNCLYVLTQYYIGVSNAGSARQNYDLLVKVYQPDPGYNPALTASAQAPDQLLPQIEFLEQQTKQSSSAALQDQQQGAP
jgi:hypothetical protein